MGENGFHAAGLHQPRATLQSGTSVSNLKHAIDLCRHGSFGLTAAKTTKSPLRCLMPTANETEFRIIQYNNGQEYLAISYSWPSAEWTRLYSSNQPSNIIRQDGSSYQSQHFSRFTAKVVSSQLNNMDPSGARTVGVWVDHECINQSDRDEKKSQIAIMDEIYINARYALIILDDVEISKDDYQFLNQPRTRTGSDALRMTILVRRFLSARWFSRAWCSQEVILSHHAVVAVHCPDEPLGLVSFSYSALAGWVVRARIHDEGLVALREPRSLNLSGTLARTTMAWALVTVYDMQCANIYDKVALVHNLMRAKIGSRLLNLPDLMAKATPEDELNVLKLVNVWAIENGDFSLLVAGHSHGNRMLPIDGFGWAASPMRSDPMSESWHATQYCGSEDPHASLTSAGIRLRGILAKILSEVQWCIWRDHDRLLTNVDGTVEEISTSWWQEGSLNTHPRLSVLRDVLLAVAHHNDLDVYRSFIHPDEDPKSTRCYHVISNLREDIPKRFRRSNVFILNLGEEIRRAQVDGRTRLSLLKFVGQHTMTVYGNAQSVQGKHLFQPHVIRPKDWGTWLYSVNAMILEDEVPVANKLKGKCLGHLRCFQMLPHDMSEVEAIIS